MAIAKIALDFHWASGKVGCPGRCLFLSQWAVFGALSVGVWQIRIDDVGSTCDAACESGGDGVGFAQSVSGSPIMKENLWGFGGCSGATSSITGMEWDSA